MAIIGIAGNINSGKDEVGKAILRLLESREPEKNWQIVKFADKLKDIICLLIGCTREQLEDKEFKETPLGEEWWYYKYPNGQLYPYIGINPEFYKEYTPIKLTPRKFLQLLGTECGRNIIHPNIWINALFVNYISKILDDYRCVYPDWIITDVRFINEAEAIKKHGGLLIQVFRPDVITNFQTGETFQIKVHRGNMHVSETALDNYAGFDYYINNNGTLQDLETQVKKILILEKLV